MPSAPPMDVARECPTKHAKGCCRTSDRRYTRRARGHSSAGRAPALQAGGRRFDPGWLHCTSAPGASHPIAGRHATPRRVRVGILGPLEVEADGRRVEVGGNRLRALLARLALDAGRAVSSAGLVEAVWEEDLPADEVHALQALVSRLRRSLGDAALVAQ